MAVCFNDWSVLTLIMLYFYSVLYIGHPVSRNEIKYMCSHYADGEVDLISMYNAHREDLYYAHTVIDDIFDFVFFRNCSLWS